MSELVSMLDKKDIGKIKDIMTNTLGEFFETVLAPYLDKMTKKLDEHSEMHDSHENHLDTLIRKAEINEDQHDRIFDKLDEIESGVKDHGKRIKRLEKTLVVS